jgi:hypothetical protein
MRTSIEVTSRKEAALIRRGLTDAQTRALVKVVGALALLPSDMARVRVLRFVEDYFNEQKLNTIADRVNFDPD